MDNPRAKTLVILLRLQPHPEGGYYGETYRSPLLVPTKAGARPAATAIYFLLTAGNFSAFHRIASDEGWHHYEGDTVHIHIIDPQGEYRCIRLGADLESGECFQAMVPAGSWFASHCQGPAGYALVGCTVAPGFDFQDFTLANRAQLQSAFPQHHALIAEFTRE